MNEQEWLENIVPQSLLECALISSSRRKERLILVECARRTFQNGEDRVTQAILYAERLADNQPDRDERNSIEDNLPAPTIPDPQQRRERVIYFLLQRLDNPGGALNWSRERLSDGIDAIKMASYTPQLATDRTARTIWESTINRSHTDVVREVFGNPFRPVPFSPNWRTSTAVTLASQMYESKDFSAMPILADALQDAECNNEDILSHCRSGGSHVRGCWVVDLVLGKE